MSNFAQKYLKEKLFISHSETWWEQESGASLIYQMSRCASCDAQDARPRLIKQRHSAQHCPGSTRNQRWRETIPQTMLTSLLPQQEKLRQ